MTSDPIELDVRSRDPVTLDVPGSAPVEWGASEYMPVVGTDAPDYDGPYEVTPTAEEQVLGTSRHLMREDVTVHEVPYHETTNESGGYTVSILS